MRILWNFHRLIFEIEAVIHCAPWFTVPPLPLININDYDGFIFNSRLASNYTSAILKILQLSKPFVAWQIGIKIVQNYCRTGCSFIMIAYIAYNSIFKLFFIVIISVVYLWFYFGNCLFYSSSVLLLYDMYEIKTYIP